jgi:hypothetical protein
MENRFEKQQEEKQDWGAYVKPPQTSSPSQESEASAQNSAPLVQRYEPKEASLALCEQVRELLPALVESDGTIRPEMAATIFAHLTVCRDCAREFDELQRIVAVLNSLPMTPLPHDYSGLIMQRIEREMGGLYPLMELPPNWATSSWNGEAAQSTNPLNRSHSSEPIVQLLSQSTLPLRQRVILLGAFFATLLLFLTNGWGRTSLGASMSTLHDWLQQIAQATESVPFLGTIVAEGFGVLAQSVHLLEETYLHIGANAMRGVFFDVALATGIYLLYQGRNQKAKQAGI